jgi:SAM-dependent methyltransferase
VPQNLDNRGFAASPGHALCGPALNGGCVSASAAKVARPASERPALWDRGVRDDLVRNAFLVPLVTSLMAQLAVSTVVDLGAGSGYLLECLACADPGIRLIAVDRDPGMADWLRHRFAARLDVDVVESDFLLSPPSFAENTRALYVLGYSLLEVEAPMLPRIAHVGGRGDILAIFMPDVFEDVIQTRQMECVMRFQRLGSVSLKKRDRFTGEIYPFHAHRLELLLDTMLTQGHRVISFHRYETPAPTHRHYCVVFERQ